ncbi:MAG: hypothetical protein ACUVT2_10595, partial [Thiobacillaceae bacterium]
MNVRLIALLAALALTLAAVWWVDERAAEEEGAQVTPVVGARRPAPSVGPTQPLAKQEAVAGARAYRQE